MEEKKIYSVSDVNKYIKAILSKDQFFNLDNIILSIFSIFSFTPFRII